MPSCAVKNCKNNSRNTKNTGVRYFSFPKKKEMTEKWIVLCKENVDPKIGIYVYNIDRLIKYKIDKIHY